VDTRDSLILEDLSLNSRTIQFKCSKFQYNFTPGSSTSIKFHQALRETSSIDVLESELIRLLLQFKWRTVRPFAFL